MVFLIVLAVAILIVSTTALIGVDNLSIGFSEQASSDTLLSAESCAEEALIRLSRNHSYAGGNLTVGDTECTMVVTGTSCGACIIDVEATGDDFTRRLRVGATMSGSSVDITSWAETE